MADNLDKIVATLGDIGEAVKGIVDTQKTQGEAIDNLKKTHKEQAPADKGEDAMSKAVNDMADMKSEIAKIKSVKIFGEMSHEKSMIDEKVKFYKLLVRAKFRNDQDAVKELQSMSDKFKYTYNFNETAGAGSGNLGYFIPTEVSSRIVNTGVSFTGQNSIVPLLNPIPMNSNAMDVGEYVDGIQAGYVAAASQLTDSVGSGGRYQLTAKKIAALVYWDSEALQDVSPALINHIEGRALNAFDYRANYIVLNGSGASDFANCGVTGILNASGTNAVTMASSSVGTLDADDFADMIDAVTADDTNGVFVISRTFRPFIRTLKDTYGQYIMGSPAGTGAVETIWGKPVVWINSGTSTAIMPAYSGVGAATAFAVYGDFGQGILFGDRMSLEVDIDTSMRFDYYQTALRYVKRQDFKVIPKYFAVLKTHA
jgi:HK97 family phage major capsid protein